MKRAITYLSFIFYLLLGIVNLIMGLYLINAYMSSDIFSITFSIVGTCLLMGAVCCFYIVKNIGGRLKHE
jgi:hypothetical protein